MQQTWYDGRTIDRSGMDSLTLAEELRAAADNAEKIAHLEVWAEEPTTTGKPFVNPYPDNRHGRRKWARELRRKSKR